MKTVPLRGKKAAGRVALVDDEDWDLVSAYKWHVREYPKRNSATYAQACPWVDGHIAPVAMHRLILSAPLVDHVNGDGLDNRRSNLRAATNTQNQHNRRPNIGHSSRFKGVVWNKHAKLWMVRITVDRRVRLLGYFKVEAEEDAARAYDAAAAEAFGEFARLNFPDAA